MAKRWRNSQMWVPPIHPARKAVLFEYELYEDNLRMLLTLQQREGFGSMSMAMRECLGIVNTLVQASEDGYEVVLRKGDQIIPCGIPSLMPTTPVEDAAVPESGTVTVVFDTELERRLGYSPERARNLPDHRRYKASPVPDGEWIGELDYKVLYPPNDNGNTRIDCHFTFLREVKCTGKYRGQRAEKYRLSIWKSDAGMFLRDDIDFGALEIEPGMQFVLGTHTRTKVTGTYAGSEWGYWNTAEAYNESARLAKQAAAAVESAPAVAAPQSAVNDPLTINDEDIDAVLGNPAVGATDKPDATAGMNGLDDDDLPKP